MKVLIVGCGYIGIALGAELVRHDHAVWGLRRTSRADSQLAAAGIRPIFADLSNPSSLEQLNPAYDWVVHCVSASGGEPGQYRETYVEGTRHLISWLSSTPPQRLIYTSSTGVYGQIDGSDVDESSPTNPKTETGQILRQAEDLLLNAARSNGFPATILRVAGIYGPGRTYWLDQLLAETARIDGAGDRILNMVHQLDVVGAIRAALQLGAIGQIYNVVDDEPVKQRVFLHWLAQQLNRPMPPAREASGPGLKKRGLTNKRVSNLRLRRELDYQLRFPTFREGYSSLAKL